jgi:hypothetical protein
MIGSGSSLTLESKAWRRSRRWTAQASHSTQVAGNPTYQDLRLTLQSGIRTNDEKSLQQAI